MLYNSERMTANNKESFMFIGVLLIFAILASGYVLYYTINDPSRNKWKLLLHCIMIITSVVPPELPMELSLAVTASMAALTKLGVFCTEPFRIPFAGKVKKCCFDKTGTITSDEITVDGVVKEIGDIKEFGEIDEDSLHVMVGCQSLVFVDEHLGGDPLEMAAMSYCGWIMTRNNVFVPSQRYKKYYDQNDKVIILKEFMFTSELKRQSCIIQAGKNDEIMCVCKGAPDVLSDLFVNKPSNYKEIYRHYSSAGKRVIALGYKKVSKDFIQTNIEDISRDTVESGLTFASFLILDSPLKHGSRKTIKRLIESSHEVCMITGDDPLTACAVATKVHMINKGRDKTVVLTLTSENKLSWIPIIERDDNKNIEYNPKAIKDLSKEYDLCVTGKALSYIIDKKDNKELCDLCDSVYIYARVSPQDKGFIISTLKELGNVTLMCGDGTNDVGALKQADVGVSILNNPDLEKRIEELANKRDNDNETETNTKNSKGKKSREDILKLKNKSSKMNKKQKDKKDSMEQLKDQLTQSLIDEGGVVKLGDASIASPFTCKSPNIDRILHIIRQGRCTLATTLQEYKILALNCLINAYFLSILYLLGAKQGDTQATCVGIVTSIYFFLISRSKPLSKLSVERPDDTVFTLSSMITILGQFLIHLYIFYSSYNLIKPFIDSSESIELDGDFKPTLLNTIMFIVSTVMTLTTFLVNYQGHPFMSSIYENEELMLLLIISFGVCACVTVELIPGLNEFLELSHIPEDIQQPLLLLMVYDVIGCYALDFVSNFLFKRKEQTKQKIISN